MPSKVGPWTDKEIEDTLMTAQRVRDDELLTIAVDMLATKPEAYKRLTDIVTHAREKMIELVFGQENGLIVVTYLAKVRTMERDLLGKAPSQLERMLCERIATCWLGVQLAEYQAASSKGVELAAFWDNRLTLASKRHTQAIESLARVRRLQLPVTQVNIAHAGSQQLNIATNGITPANGSNTDKTLPAAPSIASLPSGG